MENNSKSYSLVAWTEKGQLRMVPSLVDELSEAYTQKVEELYARAEEYESEIAWLLAISGAWEANARFYLKLARWKDAFDCLSSAAMTCAYCSDRLWLQGVSCDYPALPLFHRFLAVHARVRRLVRAHPDLRHYYEDSPLEHCYLAFTLDDFLLDREFDECREYRRAWSFGRRP